MDAAQANGMPVYILRSGGLERLRETLSEMFHVARRPDGASASADETDETDETDDGEEPDGEQD